MATTRRRSNGTYEVIFKAKALGVSRSLTADSYEEAKRMADTYQSQLDAGVVPQRLRSEPSADSELTLSHLLNEFLDTNHIADSEVSLLTTFLRSEYSQEKISQTAFNDFAERYVQHLKRDAGLKPGTIRHKVGALSRAFDQLVKTGRVSDNPMKRLAKNFSAYTKADKNAGVASKEDEHRDRRPTKEELVRIEQVLKGNYHNPDFQRPLPPRPDMFLMLSLALLTSMRMSEIYTLQQSQIDLGNKTITLYKATTKSKIARQIPLTETACEMLSDHMAARGGKYLFGHSAKTRQISAMYSRAFSRVFAHAGCEDLRFHDLRHEAICRMFLYTNLRTHEIMKISGHETEVCLSRYLNLRGHELANNFEGMDSAFRHEPMTARPTPHFNHAAQGSMKSEHIKATRKIA